jgi:ABC-type sugar transport system ATPase subunit
MDEPLSNLDAKLRVQTRTQIAALQRQLGATTVYVTHDQVEAMTMSDRVAVLKDGVLAQCDTPLRLYQQPASVFVAVVEELGSDAFLHGSHSDLPGGDATGNGQVIARVDPNCPPANGEWVHLRIRPSKGHFFSVTTAKRLPSGE